MGDRNGSEVVTPSATTGESAETAPPSAHPAPAKASEHASDAAQNSGTLFEVFPIADASLSPKTA